MGGLCNFTFVKNAYILHGVCDEEEYIQMDSSPSNAHWLPWLQQKLLRAGVLCQTLEMPTPYRPVYKEWAEVWESAQLNEGTTIVAHSAGGGFILKWLSEHPNERISKMVLAAPWFDPLREYGNFLKFDLSPALGERIGNLHLLYSEDENVEGVAQTKDLILKTLPQTQLHLFKHHGHFCLEEMKTTEFPELWEIVKAEPADR